MKKTENHKPNNIDVSIVLVNYKTSLMCRDVVESIHNKTTGINYEIIIVDNSCDDMEFQQLTDLQYCARLINPNKNLGFGQGNNLGSEFANGKYILFLNTDTILINNAIFEMFNFLEQNQNVGIVGANLFNANLEPCASYELFEKNLKNETSLLRNFLKKINKNYYHNKTNNPLRIYGYVSGACLMIKKDLFVFLGGFSKDIFMYAEETLLCFESIQKCKSLIYNVPSAKIIHLEGSSFKGDSISRELNYVTGNYTYFRLAFGEKAARKYIQRSKTLLKRKIAFSKIFSKKRTSRLSIKYEAFNIFATKY